MFARSGVIFIYKWEIGEVPVWDAMPILQMLLCLAGRHLLRNSSVINHIIVRAASARHAFARN